MYVYYTILYYRPDVIKSDFINVGIVFSIPEESYAKFVSIKDLTRFQKVDPDYDPEYFQAVLDSFHELFDHENNSDDQPNLMDFGDVDQKNFLEKRISEYANEFQFGPIQLEHVAMQSQLPSLIKKLSNQYLFKQP